MHIMNVMTIHVYVSINSNKLLLLTNVSHLPGQLIGGDEVYVKEVICSRELCGLILVLSNGRAAFVASQSAHYEPSSLHGVWISCVDNATCAAVNAIYKMAAFGRTWHVHV